jgi:uncharacterized protein (DUF302 family)
MRQTTSINSEHIVVESSQPYEKVIDALEARLGTEQGWVAALQSSFAVNPSWEQVAQTIEEYMEPSGFALFYKIDHSPLLSLLGKASRASQYTIGNPLLAIQMSGHIPEAALYAPLKLVVYDDEEGKTFVAYDSFVSLLSQYQREEITQVAQIVEQKLEALVAEVTAESGV